VRERIEHAIVLLKHKAADDEKKLAEEAADSRRAMALAEVDDKRESLRAQLELGQITEAQEIAGLRDLEAQKFAIEKQALEDRLKLIEADKLARQKIMDEIALLARQRATALTKIDNDAAIARKKQIEGMLAPVTSAIQQSIQGMIQGTQTLHRAIGNLARSILAEFVHMSVKRVITWVAGEVGMTQATVVGAATRGAVQQAAHKQGLAASAASAIKEIATSAYVTMANVYRSVSAIPYIGWILAPIAAAAAGAAVIGFGGSISSAAGGYDIPAGANPMTQLHSREMVLPAPLADVIRGMAGQGSGGGALASAPSYSPHVSFNIHALDGANVNSWLRRGGAKQISDGLRYHHRLTLPGK
jgi:hypothetical protein